MSASLTIAPAFAERLRAAGLDQFEMIMALPAPVADVTRAVPGRFTTRVEAAGGAFYLKRYRGFGAVWQAANEWERLHELRAAGIACAAPVALGKRQRLIATSESFVITEEIPNGVPADIWMKKHRSRAKEAFEPIATLARRFHDAGYCHKDLYLCHFLVQETPALRVSLIDLQRCNRPTCCARRWLVKDLAQLHYSMTGLVKLSEDDWHEFVKLYGAIDVSLVLAVERKSARIARHVPKYDVMPTD